MKLKKEDQLFLQKLQKELLEQDNLCTADPIYWGIMETEEIVGDVLSNSDGQVLFMKGEEVGKTLEEIKEYLKDEDEIDSEDLEDLVTIEDAFDLIQDQLTDDVHLFEYCEIEKLVPGRVFLTNKECQEHMKLNAHHYSKKAYGYCMHGWRSPEFERLLKILKTMDLSD